MTGTAGSFLHLPNAVFFAQLIRDGHLRASLLGREDYLHRGVVAILAEFLDSPIHRGKVDGAPLVQVFFERRSDFGLVLFLLLDKTDGAATAESNRDDNKCK